MHYVLVLSYILLQISIEQAKPLAQDWWTDVPSSPVYLARNKWENTVSPRLRSQGEVRSFQIGCVKRMADASFRVAGTVDEIQWNSSHEVHITSISLLRRKVVVCNSETRAAIVRVEFSDGANWQVQPSSTD